MRVLKFRQAIYIKDKFDHWHYWGFLPDLSFTGPDSINGLAHALDNSQQFTGLSDKSGKEIYEGDIIRCYELTNCCNKEIFFGDFKVVWHETGFYRSNDAYAILGFAGDDQREIIGDIHTTPNLLEKPK